MDEEFLTELRALGACLPEPKVGRPGGPGRPVRLDEPMAHHTTFGIGGPADYYTSAATEEQLLALTSIARRHGVPFFILGSGSNILVGDGGIRGLVIENRHTHCDEPVPQADGRFLLRAASGASFAALARRLTQDGFAGLEWACGIPGTLGGAVVYNAGAYGGCLADVLLSVRAANGGPPTQMAASELALGYRGSAFTHGILAGKLILSVDLLLHEGDAAALTQRIAELDARRLAVQPRGRNAGSIFKNTPEHPAWWLIDQVGLRGHRIGDAEISPRHTNFFVNRGRARAADIVALMDLAGQRVQERFGIRLEPEVALVGEGFGG
jgi:UDP-N-acetylmuramate dehydrogenase